MNRLVSLAPLVLAVLGCVRDRAAAAPGAAAPDRGSAGVPAAPAHDAAVVVRERSTMSTRVSISVAAPRSAEVEAAIAAAFSEVERLAALLSEWREDSEISAVNHMAGEAPVAVGAEIFAVIKAAHQISAETGGAFDITFNALGGLWDFRSAAPQIPHPDEIAARVALVDYRQVQLDPARRTVFLAKKGMKMGLGGIAKGYIVDGASAVLKARGFADHLVSAGGDLYAAGRCGERAWRVGVRDPRGEGLVGTIEVRDEGVATSGDYERFFVKDGVRYHHILDPKTGMPARGLSSVTVLAPTAMLADAYATAVFVLGKDEGLAASRARGLQVLCFTAELQRVASPVLERRLQPVPDAPPSPARARR